MVVQSHGNGAPRPPTLPVSRRLAGHADSVNTAAFGGGGAVLATGGEDGAVLLHDLRAASTPTTRLLAHSSNPVASLAWARPDVDVGDAPLAVAVGRGVLLVDARRADRPPPPPALTAADDVACVSYACDGVSLAVADDAGCVTVASCATAAGAPRVAATLRSAHDSLASSAAWRPGSARHLATGGLDCTVAVWDVTARQCVARWEVGGAVGGEGQIFNPPFVHAVAAPPSGTTGAHAFLVAAAAGDGSVLVVDGRGGGGQRRGGRRGAGTDAAPLARLTPAAGGHRAPATAVAFVDGRLLASGGDDGRVVVWDWRGAIVAADVAIGRKVQAVASGVGGRLAVCDVGAVVGVVEAGGL